MPVKINRYDVDAIASVYRDDHHCGMIFCPVPGGRSDYLASPWSDAIPQHRFDTEAEAVEYLVREA